VLGVSTPDQRAHDDDRDAAIRTVEAALAAGRIVQPDRDRRVEELRHAQTLAEVQMLVHDLQPPAVSYGPPVGVTTTQPTTPQPPRTVSKAVFVIPLVVVAVVALAGIGGVVALVAGAGGVHTLRAEAEEEDVLTEQGYADLLAAIEEQTGSTTVFSAVLYPTYAVVELPVDATSDREEYWYWDGHDLTSNDVKSTSSWSRIDLATVDPAVIVALVGQVQDNVEDPTSWYAIVRAPDVVNAVVWAYATNDYGESAYLGARWNGTIAYDSTETS
jgi:DUF1707 SHOCT-like domain